VHIEDLRCRISKAGHPDPNIIPLRREYDREEGAIIFRIEKIVEVSDDWSLIAGDAIHNLRGALDHLAWQLALRNLDGVEPKDPYSVQFPIYSNAAQWNASKYGKYIAPADWAKLKKFQPFDKELGPGARHFLEGLSEFSNADKHRAVQLAYTVVRGFSLHVEAMEDFIDCVPAEIVGEGEFVFQHRKAGKSPKPGDEIARIRVSATGPHPDVKVKAHATGFVCVRENWDILETLDHFGRGVSNVLRSF
jgi:hypothetical protein